MSPDGGWRDRARATRLFLERTRIAAGNHWYKIRHLQGCCGNDGQPGC